MKKVARMRLSPTNMNDDLAHGTSAQSSSNSNNETIVRTTGRIKKPKAVFDPSDNYLPRAQRLSSGASTPHHTPQHTSNNQASSSLERRASYTKSSSNISPGSSSEPTVLAKDVCVACKKRESKRPIFANKNRLISCLDCEKKIHKLCLKVDFEDLEHLMGHYKCEQCTICKICQAKFINPDEEMITCSKCVKSYHINCFPTKIIKSETNLHNWKCNKCQVYNQITNGTTLPVKKIREIIGGAEPSTLNNSPPKAATAPTITKTSSISNINNGNSDTALSPIKRSHDKDDKMDAANKSEDSLSNSCGSPEEKRTKPSNNGNGNQSSTDTISLDTNLSSNTHSKPDSANLCFSPNEHFDDIPDVKQWSVNQVFEYFYKHFPKEAHVFKDQEIDGRSLLLLKRSDVVKKLPIKLGPSLRIYSLILKIQAQINDPTLGWNCGL